jgi:hypothetical protein
VPQLHAASPTRAMQLPHLPMAHIHSVANSLGVQEMPPPALLGIPLQRCPTSSPPMNKLRPRPRRTLTGLRTRTHPSPLPTNTSHPRTMAQPRHHAHPTLKTTILTPSTPPILHHPATITTASPIGPMHRLQPTSIHTQRAAGSGTATLRPLHLPHVLAPLYLRPRHLGKLQNHEHEPAPTIIHPRPFLPYMLPHATPTANSQHNHTLSPLRTTHTYCNPRPTPNPNQAHSPLHHPHAH